MKVIYIAGKYRDTRGEWYVLENIRKAEEAAMFVWHSGGVALCPHKNTAFFGGSCPDDVWLQGDLELLSRCDAVYAIEGWRTSYGAIEEVKFARGNNIPCLFSLSEVTAFIIEDGDR